MKTLDGKRVAIVVANGFEQVEMTDPRKALDQAGAQKPVAAICHGPTISRRSTKR